MDAHHQSIETMDFNGKNRYTVSKSFKGLGHPWRMRVFEDRLFWTDWSLEGRLSSLNKFNGNDMKTISTDLKVYMLSLRIYHPLSQPMVPNRCAGAKCTHLCLLVPNGYKCGCPTGHKLLYDGLTCANEIGSYAFVAMEGRIVKMALNATPQPDTRINRGCRGTAISGIWLSRLRYWENHHDNRDKWNPNKKTVNQH